MNVALLEKQKISFKVQLWKIMEWLYHFDTQEINKHFTLHLYPNYYHLFFLHLHMHFSKEFATHTFCIFFPFFLEFTLIKILFQTLLWNSIGKITTWFQTIKFNVKLSSYRQINAA